MTARKKPNPPRDPSIRQARRHNHARSKRELREDSRAASLRRLRQARKVVAGAPDLPGDAARFGWFLLNVRGGREIGVANVLREIGLAGFCPVERVEVRANRYQRHQRDELTRALLTGHVAIGFPGGSAEGWGRIVGPHGVRDHRLFDVTGVIGMGGVPLAMRPDAVSWLKHMHGVRGSAHHFTPAIGGDARIAVGPYAGFCGTVVELGAGDARLELFGEGLFAGHVGITVPEVQLEAV